MSKKAAFVSIVGKPNVGKSSLLNCLLGEKISIVTNKPQTTRTKITGVLTKGETQFVFVDTPGFHRPKTRLSNSMNKAVNVSLKGVDAILLLVEPSGRLTEAEKDLIDSVKNHRCPKILIINKIDLEKDKSVIGARIDELTQLCEFDCVIPMSVKEKDGVDILLAELEKNAPLSEHYFPDDAVTDRPERVIVSEIIREKLLINMQQEIPHGTAVVIDKMRERKNGQKPIMDIEATIFCEKETHKGMIIGKGGAMLKKIGSEARADIEEFLDISVNLQCWVKVKEDWRNKDTFIRNFGLSNQD